MSQDRVVFSLAEAIEEFLDRDGVTLGPTDAALAAAALRLCGRRTIRRARIARGAGLAAIVAGFLGLFAGPEAGVAWAFDLNGDGVVNASDLHLVADLLTPHRHASGGGRVAAEHVIETPDGVYLATLAHTADPTTDYRLTGWRKIGPPKPAWGNWGVVYASDAQK